MALEFKWVQNHDSEYKEAREEVRLGSEFEKTFAVLLKDVYRDDPSIESVIGTELDTKQGTDFLFYGVPVDVTLKPIEEKGFASELYSYSLSNEVTLHYGIRTGNAVDDFETPVLVIRAECNYDLYWERVLLQLKRNLKTIMDEGCDLYWEAADAT